MFTITVSIARFCEDLRLLECSYACLEADSQGPLNNKGIITYWSKLTNRMTSASLQMIACQLPKAMYNNLNITFGSG